MLHDHAHNWYNNNKLGDLFHNSSSNNSILHNTHNNYILTKVGSMCMRQALELEKILLSSSLPCLPSFSIVIFLWWDDDRRKSGEIQISLMKKWMHYIFVVMLFDTLRINIERDMEYEYAMYIHTYKIFFPNNCIFLFSELMQFSSLLSFCFVFIFLGISLLLYWQESIRS